MIRLFCFPPAGGSAAMYRAWERALPPSIELVAVELPGHFSRAREPLQRDLQTLVAALASELRARFDAPFVFFGHSMGALLAYGLTRWLLDHDGPRPRRLLISAFNAPHAPRAAPPTYDLPDQELIAHLIHLGGVHPSVLRDREVVAHLLPALRADLALCETCPPTPPVPLPIPISVYGGAQDPMTSLAELGAWSEHTSADFDLELLPGGHFYLNDPRSGLLTALERRLRATIQDAGGDA